MKGRIIIDKTHPKFSDTEAIRVVLEAATMCEEDDIAIPSRMRFRDCTIFFQQNKTSIRFTVAESGRATK